MAITTPTMSLIANHDGRILKIECVKDFDTGLYRVHLVIYVEAQDELQVYSKIQSVLNIAEDASNIVG